FLPGRVAMRRLRTSGTDSSTPESRLSSAAYAPDTAMVRMPWSRVRWTETCSAFSGASSRGVNRPALARYLVGSVLAAVLIRIAPMSAPARIIARDRRETRRSQRASRTDSHAPGAPSAGAAAPSGGPSGRTSTGPARAGPARDAATDTGTVDGSTAPGSPLQRAPQEGVGRAPHPPGAPAAGAAASPGGPSGRTSAGPARAAPARDAATDPGTVDGSTVPGSPLQRAPQEGVCRAADRPRSAHPSLLFSSGRNNEPDRTGSIITKRVVDSSRAWSQRGRKNPTMATTNTVAKIPTPMSPRSPAMSSQVLCADTSPRLSPRRWEPGVTSRYGGMMKRSCPSP